MLKCARREAGRLDADLFAVPVASLDDDRLSALDLADPTGIAEAAFVSDLRTLSLDDLGIDEAPDLLVVAFDDAHAQRDADLVGCEAGARRVEHGLSQV